MTRNVEELFGGVITAPHQIPFTYKSNVGGETFLSLPFYPVTGVVTINGGMQVPLDNFEIEGNTLNLGRALSKGDVVYCLFDKILSPEDTAKGIRIYKFQAVGGETEFTPDFTSYGVQSLYIGGEYKTPEIEYSYNSTTGKVSLQTALTAGVWVVAEMSVKQPNISPLFDRSIQEIARSANVKDSEVILSTNTTQVLNGKSVVFDVITQRIYGLPSLPSNVYISSVSNGQITYNPGNITVNLLSMPNSIEVLSTTQGSTIVVSANGDTVEQRLVSNEQTVTAMEKSIVLNARSGIAVDDRKLIVNAHRGFSETYLEQTLMAYSQCGGDAFEIDMQTTSDGYAVCFHDDDLSIQTVTGTGAIKDNTMSTISSLRFKRTVGTRYEDMAQIPTLGSVCKLALRRGKKLMAEIKGYRTIDDCAIYNQVIGQYGLNPSTTYICFDFAPLEYIRNINKESGFGWIINSYTPDMDTTIATLASWGGSTLAINKNALETIGNTKLREWEAMGLTLASWTVYTPRELNTVLRYGIRSITLDKDFTSIVNN